MIGVSSRIFGTTYWEEELFETDFKHVEIHLARSGIPYDEKILRIIKNKLSERGLEVGVHSATKDFLNGHPLINRAQKQLLLSEIVIANKLGARDIVFHIPRTYVTHKEAELFLYLREVLALAKDLDVNLHIENNSKYAFSNADDFIRVLASFPDIYVCLDMGHLNVAAHYGFVNSPNIFVNALSSSIRRVHVHNNNGKKDEHLALDLGTFDIEPLVSLLHPNTKWIIETRTKEHAIKTYRQLKALLA